MKITKLIGFCLCGFVFTVNNGFAQDSDSKSKTDNREKVQRLTYMEQFAPELVVSVDERVAKKDERDEKKEKQISILDTLDVSERKKRRLLHDVKFSPYSNRLDKFVNTTFEEDIEE